jgi:hypothetical protein
MIVFVSYVCDRAHIPQFAYHLILQPSSVEELHTDMTTNRESVGPPAYLPGTPFCPSIPFRGWARIN